RNADQQALLRSTCFCWRLFGDWLLVEGSHTIVDNLSHHSPFASLECDPHPGTGARHWLGGQTQIDGRYWAAAGDSDPGLGRAPARPEFLVSAVEDWIPGQPSHEADPESAQGRHRP